MKFLQPFVFLWAFAIVLAGSGQAQSSGVRYIDPIFSWTKTSDIPYASAPSLTAPVTETLHLDLYEPLNDPLTTGRPTLIWTHGGRFIYGDKADLQEYGKYFAARGYVCLVINYRLDDSVSGLAEREIAARNVASDQLAAVRWARMNAATYQIDGNRIALGGSSAGAMGTLVAAMSGRFTELEALNSSNLGPSNAVQAVVSIAGATDPDFLDAGDPPLCIAHGVEDYTVPFEKAEALDQKAEQVGIPHDMLVIPGAGHGIARHHGTGPIICGFVAMFMMSHFL